ncbi:ABC transporter substrate-binding protein [Halobacteriaceae archaeon GCM10025711]
MTSSNSNPGANRPAPGTGDPVESDQSRAGRAFDRRSFLKAASIGATATLAGCLGGNAGTNATTTERSTETSTRTTEEETTTEQPDTITVTDYYGREVTVSYPVESMATLNPHVYWAVKVLGVEDTLVAATGGEMEAYPTLAEAPDVGWYRDPNVEKIAELSPDVLITHWRGPKPEAELAKLQDKLSAFDTAVVGIEIAGMELENMKLLAKLYGKEGELDPFFEWREEKLSLVEEKVADIPDDEKQTVFFESDSDMWTAKHDLPISVAGGNNVMTQFASEEEMQRRREVPVGQEKIMTVDPDFILLEDTPGPPRVTGYAAADDGPAESYFQEFLDRPGVDELSAVQNDRVHVVDYKLLSAEKSWLGALYLGKLFYPDRFSDVDPAAVHEEYYTKWIGSDYQGTYLYPSLE